MWILIFRYLISARNKNEPARRGRHLLDYQPELEALIQGVAEENVDPVEGDCAATDDCTGCDGAPEDVGSGKFPDRKQRCEHRHQNAGARNPERDGSYQAWIQKPTS